MEQSKRSKQVEKTLKSLDGIERAEAPAFLLGKIKSRLQSSTAAASTRIFSLARPILTVAALLIFILLNSTAIMQIREQKLERKETGSLKALANEYDLNLYILYEK